MPGLIETLAGKLSPTDLQSLQLEVYRQRAIGLRPADVLRQYESSRFVAPSAISPREFLRFDQLAFSVLPEDFEVIELSPLCPLGTNSVVATVDQNKVVSTVRNTEVCADATNVLALECARHKRSNPEVEWVKLCASHRVVRAQAFDNPNFTAHFRLLALCTAGRDTGSFEFETTALVEHIGFFLRLFREARNSGYSCGDAEVLLTAFDESRYDALLHKVNAPLTAQYPEVSFGFNPKRQQGRGYYENAAFEIRIRNAAGESLQIADGGFPNWTQQFLNNRKERLLVSGMGSEIFVALFG